MNVNGNGQAFILATIAFVGFFVYIIVVTVIRSTPDASVFPAIVGIVTAAGSFFFSSHIANGAAGKAMDALVQTGKDRAAAIAEAKNINTGTPPLTPPSPPFH